jgi:ADP-ribose pyrophosphatase YjhB (NUDIX family)
VIFKVLKIKSFNEQQLRQNGFVPGWRYDGGRLFNPDFAEFEHVVVTENGRALWDQVAIKERPGVIVVPYTLEPPAVGMVIAQRPIPGYAESLEFPRGFARIGEPRDEAAVRELTEEAGWKPKMLTWLGNVNPNTAFYVTATEVCAALVDSLEGGRTDGKETKKVLALPLSAFVACVAEKKIKCGLTLAAAMLFLARYSTWRGFSP